MKGYKHLFDVLTRKVVTYSGHPATFAAALAIVILWAALGHVAHYSETWQLVINTGTTIVTFLMVFLIQHSQNRDTEAIRLKLDELIRAVQEADNDLIAIDELDEEALARLRQRITERAQSVGQDIGTQDAQRLAENAPEKTPLEERL